MTETSRTVKYKKCHAGRERGEFFILEFGRQLYRFSVLRASTALDEALLSRHATIFLAEDFLKTQCP